MNAIGIALVWCVLQVTLATVVGAAVYLLASKSGWAAGRMATIGPLMMVLLLTAAALSPWPSWISSERLNDRVVVGMEAGDFAAGEGSVQANVDMPVAEFVAETDVSGPLNFGFWQSVWVEMQRSGGNRRASNCFGK